MQVLQCPKCEMRFPSASELSDHLSVDHPDFQHDEPARGDAA